MDLTEGEDIKRWKLYTEELYKKDLNDPYSHDGVITHLEPDILECKVKWALGSITTKKATGGHVELFEIPVELFEILTDDAVKVLHSICQQIWETPFWEMSLFIPISKKGNTKECPIYHKIVLISHTGKVMLRILQTRFQQ